MSSPFRHPYFLLLSRRHAALHRSANKKHAENRNHFVCFSFQSKYLIRFIRLYVKQMIHICFHTVSGLFTTRKWPTFDAKTAHFSVVSHRLFVIKQSEDIIQRIVKPKKLPIRTILKR